MRLIESEINSENSKLDTLTKSAQQLERQNKDLFDKYNWKADDKDLIQKITTTK